MTGKKFFWNFVKLAIYSLIIIAGWLLMGGVLYLAGKIAVGFLHLSQYQIATGTISGATTFAISSLVLFELWEKGKIDKNKGQWITALITVIAWLVAIGLT